MAKPVKDRKTVISELCEQKNFEFFYSVCKRGILLVTVEIEPSLQRYGLESFEFYLKLVIYGDFSPTTYLLNVPNLRLAEIIRISQNSVFFVPQTKTTNYQISAFFLVLDIAYCHL